MKIRGKGISWPAFVLIWLMIYLITITVAALIVVPATYAANEHQKTVARTNAEEYWETGSFPQTAVLFQASAFVYDADGRLIDRLVARGNNMDVSVMAKELIPVIESEDDSIYKLVYNRNLDGKFAIIITIPHFENGSLDSVYFFVKSLTSLYSNLILLFVAINLVLVMSAIYMGLIIKNNRAVEQIRRDYVANVSHDLKTPITSIRSLAEVMSEGIVTDDEKIKKYSGIILKESYTLEKTVLGMLDLSRMQSGRKDFSKSVVKVHTVLSSVAEVYSALCEEIGINLHVQEGMSELPDLYTNVACATELMNILLDNAVKFSRETGNIWLEWTACDKHITFCIRDDGAGITKDDQRRIFERFYRGDSESSGSGLGLAIAWEIASGLDEKLWVKSKPNKGAAFYFTIHLR